MVEIPEITEVDATCEVTEGDGFEDGEVIRKWISNHNNALNS